MDNFTPEQLKQAKLLALDTMRRSQNKFLAKNESEKLQPPCGPSYSYLFRPESTPTSAKQSGTYNSINISELVVDETIDMCSKQNPKISFDVSEITGRSTMNKKKSSPTIDEILATSYVPEVRYYVRDSIRDSIAKLPRTADMSRETKSMDKQENDLCWNISKISFANYLQTTNNNNNNHIYEDFETSADVEQKLKDDELLWENEYAPMPINHVAQQVIETDTSKNKTANFSSLSTFANVYQKFSNSTMSDNCSIGQYFKKHSENLHEMIPNLSPEKKTLPRALIDTFDSPPEKEPTYLNFMDGNNTRENSYVKKILQTNYLPNLEIGNVFDTGEMNKDSPTTIINCIFKDALKKSKERVCTQNKMKENTYNIINKNDNKENINSKNITPLSDTASFSESILLDENNLISNERHKKDKDKEDDCSQVVNRPRATARAKKRSHSSVRCNLKNDNNLLGYNLTTDNRSKSPSDLNELRAVSADLIRKSPSKLSPNSGKFSLPNYNMLHTKTRSISPNNGVQRCNSQCSNSSEFSHRDGTLPIKSTNIEICWGSVKLRSSVINSIKIKNMINKRLVLKTSVHGPGYQFTDNNMNSLMTLQPYECRTISITFCPTITGPAIGKIIFQGPEHNNGGQKIIKLYGFGGHAMVSVLNVQKGPIGAPFLPLGNVNELGHPLEKEITLINRGTLTAFYTIILSYKNNNNKLKLRDKSILIEPIRGVIGSQSIKSIHITFKPYSEEIKELINVKNNDDVITVGQIEIIYGDDPTRLRICELLKQVDSQRTESNTDVTKVLTKTSLKHLWYDFPNNYNQMYDLSEFHEHFNVVTDLVNGFQTKTIALTLNRDLNETSFDFSLVAESEHTLLFHSLSDTELIHKYESNLKNNLITKTTSTINNNDSLIIDPQNIIINIFDNMLLLNNNVIKIKSFSQKKQVFEINTNYMHLFKFLPNFGEIEMNENINIKVHLLIDNYNNLLNLMALNKHQDIFIMIYVENEKHTIPVIVGK